jgi:hypothetical protein
LTSDSQTVCYRAVEQFVLSWSLITKILDLVDEQKVTNDGE